MRSTSITSRSSAACACASARSASTTRSSGREAWGLGGGQTAECSAPAVEAAQTLDCMHNHPVVLLLEWT